MTVHELRRNRDMTLRELIKATGIEPVRMSNIEHDRCSDVSEEEIERIASAFGIDKNELAYMRSDDYCKQADEKDRSWSEHTSAYLSVIKVIRHRHGRGEATGTVQCPICGGQLHYHVSGLNGHTHGMCENRCLVWME